MGGLRRGDEYLRRTGASNPRKLSEPLDDGYLCRLNREERTQGYAQNEDSSDDDQNQKNGGYGG
jgi:hypothetical protein